MKTVTAETISEYRIAFETGDCSRCGGDGRYGHSNIAGNKCFLCKGSGKTYTRAGQYARKRLENTMHELMSVAVEDILPGDKIMATFYALGGNTMASFKKGWRTVVDVTHDIDSMSWRGDVQCPPYVYLYAMPATEDHTGYAPGEPRGRYNAYRGATVIRHDVDTLVQVWNYTLRLKGAWLVHVETKETIGAPTEADKSAQRAKNEQQRKRAAERRADKKKAELATFLDENRTAQAVHDFDSDDESYASETLRSMRHQLCKKGSLSPKQLNFAAKLLDEIATR